MQCDKIPCHDTQVVTLTDNGVYNEDVAKITSMSIFIRHMIPVFPFVNITTRPSQSIEEFITLALSSVSTWTGLSILALNPVKLFTLLFSARHKVQPSQQTSSHFRHDYFLTLRERQMKIFRRDLNRHERILNFLVNSRLS